MRREWKKQLVGRLRTLRDAGVRISMDGRGRWLDNVFVERLWRSVKYEFVYLKGLETRKELRQELACYNTRRPHFAFDGQKPMTVYRDGLKPEGLLSQIHSEAAESINLSTLKMPLGGPNIPSHFTTAIATRSISRQRVTSFITG